MSEEDKNSRLYDEHMSYGPKDELQAVLDPNEAKNSWMTIDGQVNSPLELRARNIRNAMAEELSLLRDKIALNNYDYKDAERYRIINGRINDPDYFLDQAQRAIDDEAAVAKLNANKNSRNGFQMPRFLRRNR